MNSNYGVKIKSREGVDGLRCSNCNRQLFFVWIDSDGQPHAYWCVACDKN